MSNSELTDWASPLILALQDDLYLEFEPIFHGLEGSVRIYPANKSIYVHTERIKIINPFRIETYATSPLSSMHPALFSSIYILLEIQ